MLSDYLYNFREIHFFFNLFNYISFRAGLSLISSFILILIFMPYWIKVQKRLFPLGQPIRSDGPSSHLSKKGTPTLGGVLIITCLSFSTILWTSNFSKFNYLLLLTIFLFGLIGFYDDLKKIRTRVGINSKTKFLLQIFSTIIIYFTIKFFNFDISNFYIPFLKDTFLILVFYIFL